MKTRIGQKDSVASLALISVVKTHLLSQNSKSITPSQHCFYYEPVTKKKCAIGILIPESHYRVAFENATIEQLLENNPKFSLYLFKKFKFENLEVMTELLTELQEIHDHSDVEEWNNHLQELEAKYVSN